MTTISFENLSAKEKENQINAFLSTYKKGTYFKITYSRQLAVLKGYAKVNGDAIVKKTTTMVVRTFIDYTNTKDYNNHNHNDNKFVSDIRINDALSMNKDGKLKIRLYTTCNNIKAKVQYTINGEPISKKDLELMNMVSTTEFKPNGDTKQFFVMLDNVLSISYR